MFTTEQINAIAQAVATAVTQVSQVNTEERYIIYIGKKPRNVKAPYIAINADGQLSGFTERADVFGHGTDRIGKWTMAEIEEKFPQYNHDYFLILADN